MESNIESKIEAAAQQWESATEQYGLGPAIFKAGVDYAMAYAKVAEQKNTYALQARCDRYEAALRVVQNWQLPATGEYWDRGDNMEPMSYEACYGSNGARDFMRNIAYEALSGEGEKEVGK
jgi:hypothetical protein